MKNKIITYLFIIYILTFSILGIIIKDNEISQSGIAIVPSCENPLNIIKEVIKLLILILIFY